MLKKILLTTLVFLVLLTSNFSLFAKSVEAQGIPGQIDELYDSMNHKWYSEMDYFAWYRKVFDPDTPESEIFGERYTAAQVQWVIYGIVAQIINLVPGSSELIVSCTGGDVIKCGEAIKKGLDAINLLSDSQTNNNLALSTIFNHYPVSGVYYISETISKFSVVSDVNAQGFGYNTANNSLRDVWTATRNLSYGLIVIAIIIISFMIMFQVKINPQTVISVQIAIPKIIIASVLITFSYAIAGLAVDLMYVVIGLLAMLLSSSSLTGFSAIELFGQINNLNAFGLMYSYWVFFSGAAWSVVTEGFGLGILLATLGVIACFIMVVIWSFKILFMIAKNFALLVITIITGPLEIMLGIITQSTGFGTWLRKLMSYLAFYPVLIVMFFLSFFFLNQGGNGLISFDDAIPFNPAKDVIGASSWQPPLSTITGGSYSILWIIVSFVIFSEITKVAEIVQSFMSGKQWSYGNGLGEAQKTSTSIGQSGLQYAVSSKINAAASVSGATVSPWVNVARIAFGLK